MTTSNVSKLPLSSPTKFQEAHPPDAGGAAQEPGDDDQPSAAGPQVPAMRRPQSRPRRGRLKFAIAGVVLAAIGIAVIGARYFVPQSVAMFPVEFGDLAVTLKGSGTLDATMIAAAAFRSQGRVTELSVTTNETVAKGEVIARIASDDLQSDFDAANASWQAAQLATRQAEAELDSATISRDDAKQTFARQKQLLERGSISRSTYDSASTTLQTSEANVASAKAAVDQASAKEQSARADMEGAKLNLQESVLEAPIAGVVIDTNYHVGDVVAAGDSVVDIADPETIVLTARLDESVISSIRIGDPATLHFGGDDRAPVRAEIIRLGREVDTETREFTVDLKPVARPDNWAIGQRATAVIETSRLHDVLSIPTDLLETRDGTKGVWVIDRGRARWRTVALGAVGGDRVAVVNGLDREDRLIAPQGAYSWMPVADGTAQQ